MKRKNTSILIWSGAVIVFGVVVIMTLGIFSSDNPSNPVKWQKAVVTRRDIGSSVLATGIIKPKVGAEVRVGSRVSGIVKHLNVNIGDQVRKGDLLAELDQTEFLARYNQALATVENAKANLDYAKLDLDRQLSLLNKNLISKNEMDMAERAFDVAKSQLKQAEANLDYDRIQMDYTKIRAPINGVVASVSTQEGETVAASFASPTFVTIIDLERLEVWAYVDETDIGRISAGQRATFTVDTYSDTDFTGKVTAIYPKAEIQDNVVNYVTIIEIAGHQGKILRPEMTTTVRILLESRQNVLTVPNKAIRRESGQKFVYVFENEQHVKCTIKAGWKDDRYTEILEGLEEGEQIVIGDFNLQSN